MTTCGIVSIQAWHLVVAESLSPANAWDKALTERYPDPSQLKNARQHSCPKGAFLGLFEDGYLTKISRGRYTISVKSKGYAVKAAKKLLHDCSLAARKKELTAQVYGKRSPNDEVNVVLALLEHHRLQHPE
jgi:Family of unknown function (DUF6979)